MTDTKQHGPEEGSLQGKVFRPTTSKELAEAVELVFDYRGDVTLRLTSGETIEGYVFNRQGSGPRPVVQVFPKKADGLREIPYTDIVSLAFTGEDTASGKSWEAWVAKKESQRKAEIDRVAAEARARGHL